MVNRNNQIFVRNTSKRSTTHPFAVIYEMECGECHTRYGCNSCDRHLRRCPYCQAGRPGEPIVDDISGQP